MKCEECIKLKKRSKVFEKGGSSTLINTISFYDEKGQYHNHDNNIYTTNYECSNGHSFSTHIKYSCPFC